MLEFLVCGCSRNEEAFLVAVLASVFLFLRVYRILPDYGVNVPSSQSADYPGSCDGGVANGNDVLQFSFEDTVGPLSVLIFAITFGCGSHNVLMETVSAASLMRTCRSSHLRRLRQSHMRL